MKFSILFLLLCLPLRAQVDFGRLLHAIGERETGLKNRVSKTGDVGVYQMSPATVRDGRTPMQHLHWLAKQLPKLGMPVSPYTLALAWRLGYGNIRDRHIPDYAVLYASDVRNIYEASLPRSH